MTSNPEPIVEQVQHEFQNLLTYVTGPDARSQTAYTVELTLFRRLLALGAALLRLFFVTRAAVRPAEPVTAPDGTRLTYHDQRPTTYYSVFGKVRFWRHFFTAPGQEGLCPLDAELSLPARCYSDLLREWAVYGTTDESYRESQTVLERILGLSLSVQALETGVTEAGADVTPFYEQPADPTAPSQLARSWSCKLMAKGCRWCSLPLRRYPCAWARGRSAARRRRPSSPACTRLPRIRAPPRRWWLPCCRSPGARSPRLAHGPRAKNCGPPWRGRQWPCAGLAQRVAQREGPHLQQRVALTDGAEALQQQLVSHFPAYTLVLDIIHATEYLWDTANALLGETHPQRVAWVRAYLEALLAGQTDAVITALEAEAKDPTLHGDATPGRTADDRLLPAQPPVYALRRVPGAGLADWHWGHRRRLWASGEGSHGAVRHAVDESRGAGRARPAGRAPQRSLGSLLAVSSATAPSTPLWHLCRCRSRRKARPWSGRRDQPALHRFWSHSIDSR